MKPDFGPITAYSYELAQAFHYQSAPEVFMLRCCAWSLPPNPVVVNIGVGSGTSSLAFAESRKDIHLYSVDISTGGPDGGLSNERNAFDRAGFHYPNQILGDSKKVGKEWDKNILADLVFIDGDHSYAGCRGDMDAWIDNLKVGGLMVFHDYTRDEWPDVKVAVTEYEKDGRLQFVIQVDTVYVTRKIK